MSGKLKKSHWKQKKAYSCGLKVGKSVRHTYTGARSEIEDSNRLQILKRQKLKQVKPAKMKCFIKILIMINIIKNMGHKKRSVSEYLDSILWYETIEFTLGTRWSNSLCSSWWTHGGPKNLWEVVKGKEIAFYIVGKAGLSVEIVNW